MYLLLGVLALNGSVYAATRDAPSCRFQKVSNAVLSKQVKFRLLFSQRVLRLPKSSILTNGLSIVSVKGESRTRFAPSRFLVTAQTLASLQSGVTVSARLPRGKVRSTHHTKNRPCGPIKFDVSRSLQSVAPGTSTGETQKSVGELPHSTPTHPPISPTQRDVTVGAGTTSTPSPLATSTPSVPQTRTETPTRTPAVILTSSEEEKVLPTPTFTKTSIPSKTHTPRPSPSPSPTITFTGTIPPLPKHTLTPIPTPHTCAGTQRSTPGTLSVFPGAEGFGATTTAGSGRNLTSPCSAIYRVTNLNDHGEGSLRACFEGSGPRTCIFEIGGVIWATRSLAITNPYLTVAGQTAPWPGIVIRGSGISVEANDILLQHIQVRVGDDLRASCCKTGTCDSGQAQFCTEDPGSRDGIRIRAARGPLNNIVLDHISISWSLDEGFSIVPEEGDVSNITFSNSIIASGLDMSIHPEASNPNDKGHSKGVLINGAKAVKNLSFIKNLLAHNADRNIRIATPITMEYLNNIIYNWGRGGGSGRLIELTNKVNAVHKIDAIGNKYIPGPDTFCPETTYQPERCYENGGDGMDSERERASMHYMVRVGGGVLGGLNSASRYFLLDNITNTRASLSSDEWLVGDKGLFSNRTLNLLIYPQIRATTPVSQSETVHILSDPYTSVKATAGARPGQRDSVDQNIIEDITHRSGQIINCVAPDGSERCQKNAGGWPAYSPVRRPLTLPADPGGDMNGNGYTNLEEWLFAFSDQLY